MEGREEKQRFLRGWPCLLLPHFSHSSGTTGKVPMFLLQPQETYYPGSHSVPSVPLSSSRQGGSREWGRVRGLAGWGGVGGVMVDVGSHSSPGNMREVALITGNTNSQSPACKRKRCKVQMAVRCREGSVLPKITQAAVHRGGTRVHPELGSAGQLSWVYCAGVAGQGTGSAWEWRVGSPDPRLPLCSG